MPLVPMMKATNAGQSNNFGLRRQAVLGGSAHRRISELRVDSIDIVIVDVFAEKTVEVLLVQNDHVIQ